MPRLDEGRRSTGGFRDVVLRCSACQATYRIDGERVQTTRLKVRCPSCGHVFRVRTALREPAYAGGDPSGAVPSGGLDIVRDERRPPQLPARRTQPRPTPSRPLSPASTPKPEMPRWDRERTIDFEAGRGRETPGLETAPFRPGQSRAAAPTPQQPPQPSFSQSPPLLSPPLRSPSLQQPSLPQPPVQRPHRHAAPPEPPAPAPQVTTPRPPPPAVAPPAPPRRETPWAEREVEPPPVGSLPTLPLAPAPERVAPPRQKVAPPAPVSPTAPPDPAHERALRLARVLVSDIVVYNQTARDRALREGNLASALGGEINRAWEMYKSKVDSEVLRSTSYFKDALNEILASGQTLF